MNGMPKKWIVFFDFDNTITSTDILDNIINRFSINDEWKALEKLWVEGKMGSKECLDGQLRGIRIQKKDLAEYLAGILIDPSFGKLLQLLRSKGIDFMITSDSFSFFIKEILRHNGIKRVKVYANGLKFRNGRMIPSFPNMNPDCQRCGHCKKRHILEHAEKTTVYVGDGLSDVCPAKHADVVFAKDTLLEFCHKNKKPCMEFKELKDVYAFFEDMGPIQNKSRNRYKKSDPVSPTKWP